MKPLLIVNCGEVVTMAGPDRGRIGPEMSEIGLIRGGAVLIADGLIAAVGPREEVEWVAPPDADVLDAGGRLLTPGLVDAHTHFVFGGDRLDDFEARCAGQSYQQIAERGGGIWSTVLATRACSVDELEVDARLNLMQLQTHGTTTVEGKSGYGLSYEGELRILGRMKALGEGVVPTLLAAHAYPRDSDPAAYVRMIVGELIPLCAQEGLARYVDAFVEDGYFAEPEVELMARAAAENGLGLRLHVDQLRDSGGAALAARLGAVTADHLEHTGSEGIAAMAEAGVTPVLLPGSVWGLGLSRYANARAMIEAGLPVVVATDFNPGSSPVPSLPFCMALACRFMGMSPAEALSACTINAAASLGLQNAVGSLVVGKKADLVLWNAKDYRELAYGPGFARPFRMLWASLWRPAESPTKRGKTAL